MWVSTMLTYAIYGIPPVSLHRLSQEKRFSPRPYQRLHQDSLRLYFFHDFGMFGYSTGLRSSFAIHSNGEHLFF
jgi:hypothetical protein